jgi:aminomethyltransferase
LPVRSPGRTIRLFPQVLGPNPVALDPHPQHPEEATMAFDMSQVQRGARNRRTPYHEAAQRYDPKGYTVYNHMYFPIRFDTFEAEYETLLNGVTLWDVSVERCLEISGPDGFRFAQLLTPRDLSKCAVGQAKYVLICDADGGIVNDPVLTRMAENTFWFALASSDALLFARGLKNAYPDLDVSIKEADVAPLQVQGPKSKELMAKLLGEEILDLKYYYWTEAKIAGAPVVITRTGWTSEVGYEVYLTETTKGDEVYEAIMEAGREFGIKPTGPSDIRRIEGAIFNWGADMTYENNPVEMGLDRLVDWDLPDEASISIRALRQIRDRGVDRRINGVELDGEPFLGLNDVKWPVVEAGRQIGQVTSAIYSPRLERNIGFAWLPSDRSKLGSTVQVESEWGPRTATVVEMPFIDPNKQIPVS